MKQAKTELKQIFTQYWQGLALNAACKLELFDKIQQGQNQSQTLVQNNGWSVQGLENLLQFLENQAYLKRNAQGQIQVLEKGLLLCKSNPQGLYYACLNWAAEHLLAWQELSYSIETGKSSFEKLYQQNFFDYLDQNPQKQDHYHRAMAEYARDDYQNLGQILDFSQAQSLMDLGGGYGMALKSIKKTYPKLKCYLFDLPKVIAQIPPQDQASFEVIQGDFLKHIPALAQNLLLSRILHDWPDEQAQIILEHCHQALPQGGKLYLIENCSDQIDNDLSLLSLNMLCLCQSYERSSQAYENLAHQAGFKLEGSKKINDLQTALIFVK